MNEEDFVLIVRAINTLIDENIRLQEQYIKLRGEVYKFSKPPLDRKKNLIGKCRKCGRELILYIDEGKGKRVCLDCETIPEDVKILLMEDIETPNSETTDFEE